MLAQHASHCILFFLFGARRRQIVAIFFDVFLHIFVANNKLVFHKPLRKTLHAYGFLKLFNRYLLLLERFFERRVSGSKIRADFFYCLFDLLIGNGNSLLCRLLLDKGLVYEAVQNLCT